jgi:hypothetical protein
MIGLGANNYDRAMAFAAEVKGIRKLLRGCLS